MRPTCEIRRCRRPSFHLTLKGRLGSHDIAQMCTFHWNLLSLLTAPGRLTISGVHRLKTIRVGQLHVFAAYRRGTIYVTEHFANCTPEQMVYTLSHETVHHVLNRDVGFLTSIAWDILYKRSLTCLGGHSVFTFDLNRIYRQANL